MKALDLSEKYFIETAFPALQTKFPELVSRMAVGLVGNGSECFGYDDEISRDHDWGIDFFIWLSESDREMIPQVAAFKKRLFEETPPEFKRERSEYGALISVMTAGDFYKQLIGFPEGPDEIKQWRMAPEENLSMTVNGRVFYDGDGRFTKTREKLLQYFPEDLRRKKMAARCMALAQTGQYNYMRMSQRQDWVTVQAVLTRFCENAAGIVFLLNRTFRPFYKWAYRKLKELPILGDRVGTLVYELSLIEGFSDDAIRKRHGIIKILCSELASELRRKGLTRTEDWFFTSHAEELQKSIGDSFLSSLPTQYE
jgi:hypothetical protein